MRKGENDGNGDENSFLGVVKMFDGPEPPLTRRDGVLGNTSGSDIRVSVASAEASSLEDSCCFQASSEVSAASFSLEDLRAIGVLMRLSL